VCGGIASGKSKACQILNTANDTEGVCLFEGASIVGHVDVDKLAHTVYEPGSPIMQEITNIFGQGVLASDQSLDRAALGSIVFSDRSKMSTLESIVWPHVKQKLLQKLKELERAFVKGDVEIPVSSQRAIAVVEAAMLLDSGWDDLLDAVWVVRTPRELALERMVTHRKMAHKEAALRLDAQATRRGICPISLEDALRNKVVTAVIDNDSDCLDTLTQRLQQAWDNPNCWKDGCCPK